uniref:Receptor protein-tyrosine kinase n=1 Tax=Anopheles minimus TaxID=112268 RepID=A0A182WA11_9DIPT
MMGKPATVILVVTSIAILSVFHRATLVSALDDHHVVNEQDSNNAHGAPEIDTVEETITLPKGASWNFTCKSQQPIMWKHYAASYYWDPPIAPPQDFQTDDPDKPYGSMLVLTDASAELVGRYYCVNVESYHEDLEDRLDDLVAEYLASTIYVYVDDPENPLVPIHSPAFRVDQYDDFVVPCKPTRPDIEVELYKDLEGDLVEEYRYSDTQGYKLSFNRLEDGGSYYCQVKDKSQHPIHFQIEINEHSIAEYLTKPSIQSDTKDHVPLGQRIRLVCKVKIRAGVKLEMTWKVPPNLRPAVKDGRTKIGPLKVEPVMEAEHREIASRELIIERATQSDDGTYRCEVQDLNSHRNYHSFKLHVRDSTEDFVDLREENNLAAINMHPNADGKTGPINIVIKYDSYPSNITYYWLKDDDEITAGHNGKYLFTHSDTHVRLRVNDPDVFDTGNYTVFVMAGNAEKSHRMAVHVFAKPILHMESRFVKPNEEVSFQCRSIGFPRPDISFAFLPCLAEPWTNCSVAPLKKTDWDSSSPDIGSAPSQKLHPGGKRETLITKSRIYTIIPNQPGVVYCKAINTEGSEVTQADLLISDLPDSITLEQEQPKETITVGDHVTIVCSALVYNHTKDITFKLNDKVLQESDGVRYDYSKTLYAWQARLDIDHVTNDHEGTLHCSVKTLSNTDETRAFHLEVLEPIAPKLVSGTTNQSLSIDLHVPLKLECDVVGTPDPKIVWLKDGVPVEQDENSNRVQLTKTTLIFEYLKMEELGTYECRAENKMGTIEKYWKLDVQTAVVRKSLIYIIVCLFLLLIVAIVMVSMFYCKKKKEVKAMKEAGIVNFEEGNLGVYNPDLALDEQADLLPYNSEYEFPKERLKLGKQLGTGAFGVVMKASATRIMVNEDETTVAVKMVKKQTDNEVMRALISELKIMVHLGQHLNVVNLLGAVTKNISKRELMVIVEYCRFGNVQNFLLKHRPYFIDQINQETGEIDSSIDKNQLRWSKCGYQYNSGSTQYVDPKKHLNSKGYVRHSGLQNMGMVDSCNTEVTAMTSVEVEDLNTDLKSRFNAMLPDEMRDHYMELNEPYLQMNAEKVERGETDYLANLGPPEEPAPTAPNYVNGIILPLPPKIRNDKDYLKMSRAKSESQESNFDFASFNSERHSPTTRNNLDTSPPNGSKRHKKLGLPEEIPMLDGNRLSSTMNGYNSDSETEPVSPTPRERASKHNPEPQYMNVKNQKFAGRPTNDEMGSGIAQEAISNPGYIALSMVDEKR